jgi:acid stress chaperone HdeB
MKIGLYTVCLLALVCTSAAQAQMIVDVSKVNCRQFVSYEVTDTRSLSLWLSGFYNAQQNNTIVDVAKFRSRSNALKDYCLSHQNEPLMDAAKTVLGSSSKK